MEANEQYRDHIRGDLYTICCIKEEELTYELNNQRYTVPKTAFQRWIDSAKIRKVK